MLGQFQCCVYGIDLGNIYFYLPCYHKKGGRNGHDRPFVGEGLHTATGLPVLI